VEDVLVQAHKRCLHHRGEIARSKLCGCFHCLRIFEAGDLGAQSWVDDDDTATCPFCSIDAVIGDASGFPVNAAFLNRMHQRWFENRLDA
jgi:hypothetical protein